MDGIRSELKYFEQQIEKLDYHYQRMNEVEEFSKTVSKESETPIHDEQANEARQIYEKMYRKIKKLNHYLDEKLSSSSNIYHSEL